MNDGKTYEVKIFDSSMTYITSMKPIISDYVYSQGINTAGNPITIELGINSDDDTQYFDDILADENFESVIDETGDTIRVVGEIAFGGVGGAIEVNRNIEVWCYYGSYDELVDETGATVIDEAGGTIKVSTGSPQGIRKFAGFISSFSSRYGETDTVVINCLPYGVELDNTIIKSGTATNVSYLSVDPSAIARSIMDNYILQGGSLSYDSSTIDNTLTVVSYTYKLNTSLEGIKKVQDFAPKDWWWYVDVGTKKLHLHRIPTTPAHTFVLGKHLKDVDLAKSIEGIVNDFYFMGGDTNNDPANPNYLFKEFTDATSIASYRRKIARQTDGRVTDPDSVNILGNAKILENKNPRYTGTITILDLKYDIETIEIGQVVAFANFGNYIDALRLQIMGMKYTPDYVTLTLDSILPQPSKRLEDIRRNLLQSDTQDIPSSPS